MSINHILYGVCSAFVLFIMYLNQILTAVGSSFTTAIIQALETLIPLMVAALVKYIEQRFKLGDANAKIVGLNERVTQLESHITSLNQPVPPAPGPCK